MSTSFHLYDLPDDIIDGQQSMRVEEDLETRQAILDQIAQLQMKVIEKKRLLNRTVLVIARLHPDVLAEVFIHLALSTLFEDAEVAGPEGTRNAGRKTYGWLRVTWVCHYWREVALNCPQLWSQIRLTNSIPFMHMMFARSKQASLDLAMEGSSQLCKGQVLDLVISNLPRIQSLAMTVGGFPQLSVAVPAVAPSLTHLALTHRRSVPRNVPILLGRCDMPRLTHVELRGIFSPWQSAILRPSLTHLVVTAPRPGRMKPLLSTALGGMPLLEHLDLTSFSPTMSIFEAPAGQPSLHLPHLRFVKLGDSAQQCGYFLSHLAHPASTRIALAIEFTNEAEIAQECRTICDAVTPVLEATCNVDESGPSTIPSVVVRPGCPHGGGIRVVLFPGEKPYEELAAASTSPRPSCADSLLDIAVVQHSTRIRFDIEDVRLLLPLGQTKTLCINNTTASINSWKVLPAYMLGVEELIMQAHPAGWSIPQFLGMHYQQRGTNQADISVFCVFPKVRRLVLSCVVFRDQNGDMKDDSQVKVYAEILAIRKKAGAMVEELVLYACHGLAAGDVEQLQTSARRVLLDPYSVRCMLPLLLPSNEGVVDNM